MTAGASYTVRLHFAELTFTGAWQRVFNVAINGTSVLSNFDVFASAGGENIGLVEQFSTTASSSGNVVISFTQGSADNPDIAGIEILSGGTTSGIAPSVPANPTASAGNASVALAWNASTGSATITYNVYRSTTSGGEGATPLAKGITSTSYTDSTVSNGTTYYYTVSATNSVGTSAQSSQVSATPQATGTAPTVPATRRPQRAMLPHGLPGSAETVKPALAAMVPSVVVW